MISSLIGVLLIVIIVVLKLLKNVVDGVIRIIIVGEFDVYVICNYIIYYSIVLSNLFFHAIYCQINMYTAKNVRQQIGKNIRQHANALARTAKNGMKI